jgi:hypothetical protein
MLSLVISVPVASFIRAKHRQFRPAGSGLSPATRLALEPYFPASLLDNVRVVTGKIVRDPWVAKLVKGLRQGLPSFQDVAAVTFSDVIVFHEAVSSPLMFHELVHVVQYQQLGILNFSRLYVRGFLRRRIYEDIPLEQHAYELGRRFEANPRMAFSVANEVASRIAARGY